MEDKLKRLIEIADKDCKCTNDQQTGKDPSLCIPCTASGMINSFASYITTAYTEINQMIDDDVTKLMEESGYTPLKGLPCKDNPLGDDDNG